MDFSKQHAWLAYYSKRCMQSVRSYTPVLRCELDSDSMHILKAILTRYSPPSIARNVYRDSS